VIRGWDFPYGRAPTSRRDGAWGSRSTSEPGGSSSERERRSGTGGGALIAILIAIAVILITWGISTLIRLALSRSREYLADAASVELTKNPTR
jgi:heat shock protein HtpX